MANSPGESPKVQLGIGVDASGAEQSLDGLGKKFEALGATVEKISDSSGRSFEKVTTSAGRVSSAVEKATNTLAASVKRATDEQSRALAELQAGGKNTVDYFQKLGEIRGVDTAKLDPIINKLNDVRAAIAAAQAKQEEFSASRAFDKKVEDARRLNQASEYVRFWTDSLDKAEAKEREFASVAAFEKKHQDAKKFVQDAEYVKFWTAELEKADAVQAKLATNNSFVERLKKESEAIGKTRADLLELQAAQMGLTKETAPYIAKLREQEGAIGKAGKALNEYGMTAKASAAALRQVPAQFTDIIVSLQGGQAPLTVLLQQGGQLKDVFGGAGAAARAMGGYIAGLLTPLTAIAAAVGAVAYGFYKTNESFEAFNAIMISSGNQIGMTADELVVMSEEIGSFNKAISQSEAAKVMGSIASSGIVAKNNIRQLTEEAIKFEKFGGASAEKVVKAYEELATKPFEAVQGVQKAFGFLTVEQAKAVAKFKEMGQEAKAAELLTSSFLDSISKRTPQLEENLTATARLWGNIKDGIAGATESLIQYLEKATGTGTLQNQLDKAQRDLAGMQANKGFDLFGVKTEEIENQKILISGIEEKIRLRKEEAKVDGATASGVDKIIKGMKDSSSAAQDEIAKIKAKIDAAKLYSEQLDIESIKMAKLTEGEAEVLKLEREKQKMGLKEKEIASLNERIRLNRELGELQRANIQKEVGKTIVEESNIILQNAKGLDQLYKNELDLVGMTALERSKILAARKVELDYAQKIEKIMRSDASQAKKDEAISILVDARALEREAAVNKVIQDDFAKTAEQINQSLTDALLRGFESGKGFADNFKSTLENMFKSMVLRPVISAILAPVSGALTAGFGGAATAGQAGGAMGAMGAISSASSLYTLLNTGVSKSIEAGFGKLATSEFGQKMGMSTAPTDFWDPTSSATMTAESQSIGNALGMAGNAIAGYAIQKALSGGYQTNNNKAVDAITLAASAYFGPVAGVAGAAFNRAFGQKLSDVGLMGTFGGQQGFTGKNYQSYSGGWFSSDSTSTQAVSNQTRNALASQFRAIQVSTALMAQNLGQGTDAIQNFTKDVRISLNGLTGEQAAAKFQEEVDAINEAMAGLALGTADFNKLGESNVTALNRLSTGLTTVNSAFDILGNTLYENSLKGADLASQLVDLFGSLDTFTQATSSYYDAFYSESEKTKKATDQVTSSLADLGYVMPATKEQFRAIVEAQDLTTAAGQKTYASLIKLSGAFAQVTDAAATSAQELYSNAQAATNLAFDAVKKSIDAASKAAEQAITDAYKATAAQLTSQKDLATAAAQVAQENVNTFKGVFDLLKTEIASLIGDTTAAMSSLQGRAFIEQSIATAQATGYLPDQTKLAEAITAVKTGFEKTAYASAFEQQRDRLVLASRLNELKLVAGEQMTAAEQQLQASKDQVEALNAQIDLEKTNYDGLIASNQAYYKEMLDQAQSQVDAINGVNTSVLSVADAMAALASAIASQSGLKATQTTASMAAPYVNQQVASVLASGNAASYNANAVTSSANVLEQQISQIYSDVLGRAADVSGMQYWASSGASVSDIAASIAASAEAQARAIGTDVQNAMIKAVNEQLGLTTNITARASGGYTPSGLTLVGEKGPEIINFKNPGMVYNAGQTDSLLGGGEAMIAEVRGLREDNQAQARATVQLQAKMNKILERWDGDGIPETRAIA